MSYLVLLVASIGVKSALREATLVFLKNNITLFSKRIAANPYFYLNLGTLSGAENEIYFT